MPTTLGQLSGCQAAMYPLLEQGWGSPTRNSKIWGVFATAAANWPQQLGVNTEKHRAREPRNLTHESAHESSHEMHAGVHTKMSTEMPKKVEAFCVQNAPEGPHEDSHESVERIFLGHQEPTPRDILDAGPGMSRTNTLCKVPFWFSTRNGRDVPRFGSGRPWDQKNFMQGNYG